MAKGARWANTGGDLTIHLVSDETPLIDPAEFNWQNQFQVTRPIGGCAVFHGPWLTVKPLHPNLVSYCSLCFDSREAS